MAGGLLCAVQSGDTEYSVDIDFMKPVDPEDAVSERGPLPYLAPPCTDARGLLRDCR